MSTLLALSGVCKSYRRGAQEHFVLREVDLAVDLREMVSVIGVRGQGKTTLLRIAAGMERADAGAVSFAGEDLNALGDRELSRLLGSEIAWAGRNGPGMRVRMLDYVAMPLIVAADGSRGGRGSRRERGRSAHVRAHAALERVGAQGCANQRWEEMSDWERALVEIAQGIAGEPSLLLVDDLTDTLGIRETDELTTLLRSLTRDANMSVLMSVSDAQSTLWSDRIVTLSGGRLSRGPESTPGDVIEFPRFHVGRGARRSGSS